MFLISQAAAQPAGTIRGKVTDTSGHPLPFCTISIVEDGKSVVSKIDGTFAIAFPPEYKAITLRITYVGKATAARTITKESASVFHTIMLQDNSLNLTGVEVNAVRQKAQSNTSYIINREAIDQIQAYSLADILQLIPGKQIQNTNLQGAKSLTLRTTADGPFAQNSAFGTAIYVDGAVISNNANMQAGDIARNGNFNTFSPPATNGNQYSTGDFSASGFDLRQIDASTIERVEVISGIAPARYGDITDGAVIIERRAGISPWRTSVRLQSGVTNFSASKGIKLKGKGGVLSTSLDYVNSVADKRDKLKSFNRLTAAVMWTKAFFRSEALKNTLSLDIYSNLDGSRENPDEGDQRKVLFRNYGIRVNNRGHLSLKNKWLQEIHYTVAASYGVQESYDHLYYNPGVKPVTARMETGTYEGEFAPPNYLAVREIKGKPFSASGRLEIVSSLYGKVFSHRFSAGITLNYDDNFGEGRLFNPLRPRRPTSSYKSERPYYFSDEVHLVQTGLYLQDDMTIQAGTVEIKNNWGIRFDKQGSRYSVSPRLNTALAVSKSLSILAAFGLSTKAPGLIHLYPGMAYYDIALLSSYTNNPRENLYLVHTEVVNPQNSALVNAIGQTTELGAQWKSRMFNLSVTAYRKTTRRGFTTRNVLHPLTLPNYIITDRPENQKPVYTTDGASRTYLLTYNKVGNSLYSRNQGLELIISTGRIKAIQTSFNFSTVYNESYFHNPDEDLVMPEDIDYSQKAIIGIFPNKEYKNSELISTLSTSHHIPVIGLLVNWRIQSIWLRTYKRYGYNGNPIAYINQNNERVVVDPKDQWSNDYAHLRRPVDPTDERQPIIVTNYHLRVAKQIGKKYRFSFYANNFFNYRPTALSVISGSRIYYNEPPAYGAEISLQF